MRYALLRLNHPNTRYDACLDRLAAAELEVILKSLGGQSAVCPLEIGGLTLLTFDFQGEDLSALCRHSSLYALFELSGELLRPLRGPEPLFLKEMPSILKYKGKTNETFTRMLVNLAVFSSSRPYAQKLSLLDPMAGKGTTLYCALGCGYNAFGVEMDKGEVAQAVTFIKSYFEHTRQKHSYGKTAMTLNNGSALRHQFVTAKTSQLYKAGDVLELEIACASCSALDKLWGKKLFDEIVADLPYGIQHGGKGKDTLSFVAAQLPLWKHKLSGGGAVALSFNSHTIKREQLHDAMAQAGLTPMTGGPYDALEHYVEQAVTRDVAVGVKL